MTRWRVPLITVLYSCPLCGLRRAECAVLERSDGQSVIDWMEQTTRSLSDDHARRSPMCNPQELKDVMIPMTGRTKVGGPVEN